MFHNRKDKFEKSERGKDPRYNGTNLALTGNPLKFASETEKLSKKQVHPVRTSLSLEVESEKKGRLELEPRILDPEFTGKGGVVYTIA